MMATDYLHLLPTGVRETIACKLAYTERSEIEDMRVQADKIIIDARDGTFIPGNHPTWDPNATTDFQNLQDRLAEQVGLYYKRVPKTMKWLSHPHHPCGPACRHLDPPACPTPAP